MNNNNRNPWDGRRPSLDRWWESPESQNKEILEKNTSSPNAIQNTKQWIDRSLKQPNENTTGKNCKEPIAKKSVSKQNNFILIYKCIILRPI